MFERWELHDRHSQRRFCVILHWQSRITVGDDESEGGRESANCRGIAQGPTIGTISLISNLIVLCVCFQSLSIDDGLVSMLILPRPHHRLSGTSVDRDPKFRWTMNVARVAIKKVPGYFCSCVSSSPLVQSRSRSKICFSDSPTARNQNLADRPRPTSKIVC